MQDLHVVNLNIQIFQIKIMKYKFLTRICIIEQEDIKVKCRAMIYDPITRESDMQG